MNKEQDKPIPLMPWAMFGIVSTCFIAFVLGVAICDNWMTSSKVIISISMGVMVYVNYQNLRTAYLRGKLDALRDTEKRLKSK